MGAQLESEARKEGQRPNYGLPPPPLDDGADRLACSRHLSDIYPSSAFPFVLGCMLVWLLSMRQAISKRGTHIIFRLFGAFPTYLTLCGCRVVT